MYSDASRSFKKGFGAFCGNSWTYGRWHPSFIMEKQPSIEYLELYGLTVGVLLWIHSFQNRVVNLFCDNESVKFMVNDTASKCKNCMFLLRLVVLEGLARNVKIKVKYVKSKDNDKADALSRMQFKRFRRLAPKMDMRPTPIPDIIWPLSKLWID